MVEEFGDALAFSHKQNKKTHLHVKQLRTSTECWQKNINLQKWQESLDRTGYNNRGEETERMGIRTGIEGVMKEKGNLHHRMPPN